MRKQTQITYRK